MDHESSQHPSEYRKRKSDESLPVATHQQMTVMKKPKTSSTAGYKTS